MVPMFWCHVGVAHKCGLLLRTVVGLHSSYSQSPLMHVTDDAHLSIPQKISSAMFSECLGFIPKRCNNGEKLACH